MTQFRRGHSIKSNWGRGSCEAAVCQRLTAFERMLENQGLETDEAIVKSPYAKEWALHYVDKTFIPEKFLKAWGIFSSADLS